MRDVGVAADALLAAVRGVGEDVGGADAGGFFGLEVGGEQAVEAFQVFGEVDRRMHVRRNQRRFVERARHHAGVDGRNRPAERGGTATVTFHPVRMVLTCCCG
jgi:hypothetical protein